MTISQWKRRKFEEEGLCLNCCKRPAGGDGGTLTACAICAEQKRNNEEKRLCRLDPSRYFRQRRKNFKKDGLCVVCGHEKEAGHAKCANCRAAAEEWRQMQKQEALEARISAEGKRIDRMFALSERLSALDKLRRA